MRDLETIIVFVSLGFNFIDQRSHHVCSNPVQIMIQGLCKSYSLTCGEYGFLLENDDFRGIIIINFVLLLFNNNFDMFQALLPPRYPVFSNNQPLRHTVTDKRETLSEHTAENHQIPQSRA